MCKHIFGRNIYVRFKFSCVRPSHGLCACAQLRGNIAQDLENGTVYRSGSASQPFFNHGTLTWNNSPDGTLHFGHSYYKTYIMMYKLYICAF